MAFPFLDDVAHRALDESLRVLLSALRQSPPEPYRTTANRGRPVIRCAQGKLIRPGWRNTWLSGQGVAWAWFGDINHDEVVATLHAAFTELVRYVESAKSEYRQKEYAGQLTRALKDYLSLRGHPVDEPACPWQGDDWDELDPRASRLLVYMEGRGQADLRDLCPAVWGKDCDKVTAAALATVTSLANNFLATRESPRRLKKVRGESLVRWT